MQPLAPAAAGTCRNITQQYFRSLSTCTAASVASDTHARKEWLQMEITDLKIRKMMTDGRLRAIVSITLDQMLAVHDIKVVQGESRLFVAMPSRKDEGGIFRTGKTVSGAADPRCVSGTACADGSRSRNDRSSGACCGRSICTGRSAGRRSGRSGDHIRFRRRNRK